MVNLMDKEQALLFCKIAGKLSYSKSLTQDIVLKNSLDDILEMISLYCDTAPDNLLRNNIDVVMEHKNYQIQKGLVQ
jgi:hypothetical protein